jgi:hypothetical protein
MQLVDTHYASKRSVLFVNHFADENNLSLVSQVLGDGKVFVASKDCGLPLTLYGRV